MEKHFQRNSIFLTNIDDFEPDNEIDNSSLGSKTTKIYKQNPVCVGYSLKSELENVLESSYYEYLLGYESVDIFLDELSKIESKMIFYFKNNKKDIKMAEEDEEDFRNNNVCRFSEKKDFSVKIRDYCHLTGKCREPAHN